MTASQRLASHPDRIRWNAKYEQGAAPGFVPHELAMRALALLPSNGPVLELACGPSGSVLLAAEDGRRVTAVDVSDVALDLLATEAGRRGVAEAITLVHADLGKWRPSGRFGLVLCTGYWDRVVFERAHPAVAAGGMLAWEALTIDARRLRPDLPAEWCVAAGEPASLLPSDFDVLDEHDLPDERHCTKRRLLAVRHVRSGA